MNLIGLPMSCQKQTHPDQPKLFHRDGIGSGGDSAIILHNTQPTHRLQEPQSERIFPH